MNHAIVFFLKIKFSSSCPCVFILARQAFDCEIKYFNSYDQFKRKIYISLSERIRTLKKESKKLLTIIIICMLLTNTTEVRRSRDIFSLQNI